MYHTVFENASALTLNYLDCKCKSLSSIRETLISKGINQLQRSQYVPGEKKKDFGKRKRKTR